MMLFGRRKEKAHSFDSVFGKAPDSSEYIEEAQPEVYVEEVMETEIEKLFNKLMEMTDDNDQWAIHETGEDEDGYSNYEAIHKTKPITIKFDSFENENEATILVSGEDVESIIGYDAASDIANQIYYMISDVQEALDAEREVRNNESATKILSILND